MAKAPGVVLDSIRFYDREVPDFIPWGTKQQHVIHRNMGGTRVIDAMGPDPKAITWTGHLLSFAANAAGTMLAGTNAAARARSLEALAGSGRKVWLQWGSFGFWVLVVEFEGNYKHEWDIHYTITCEVVTSGGVQSFTQTLDQVVSFDVSQINAIANAFMGVPALSGSSTITPAMVAALTAAQNAAQLATSGGKSLETLSITQLQPVVSAFENAYSVFQSGIVPPAGIDLDATSGASVLDGINAFVAEANSAAGESDVQIALSYLGRIVGNLTLATG